MQFGTSKAALKINSSSDDAKYNLAEAYFQSGNYKEAMNSLLEISLDGQKESSYLGLLGDVYARLSRYEDAARCLEQAVAATPDNDQYHASLALVKLRMATLRTQIECHAEGWRTFLIQVCCIGQLGLWQWFAVTRAMRNIC